LRAPDEQDTAPGDPSRAPFPNKALPLLLLLLLLLLWLCCDDDDDDDEEEFEMGRGESGQESD
jgi:hypothetical protein